LVGFALADVHRAGLCRTGGGEFAPGYEYAAADYDNNTGIRGSCYLIGAPPGGGLAETKQRLIHNRRSTPLFDTTLFARHIEAAYSAMNERCHADLCPDDIHVPGLPVS
jgi:hypothetical protein